MDSTAGPLNQLISDALAVIAPHVPRDLTWPILLLTVGLATTIWLLRNGGGAKGADGRVRKMPLRQFLLPSEIYTHASARVDVGLYVFERCLRPLWVTTLLVGVAPGTETLVVDALNTVLGSGPGLHSHYGWMLLYSLVTLLLYDCCFSHSLRGAQNPGALGYSQSSPFGRSADTAHPLPGAFSGGTHLRDRRCAIVRHRRWPVWLAVQ